MTLDGPRRAAGYAPAHVTGFFEIRDEAPEVEKRGSRGAGFCVRPGARSVVTVEPADALAVDVAINRVASEAPVTTSAVARVLETAALDARVAIDRDAPRGARAKARVVVHTDLDLPVGQGFGMSAAGALSAAMATARALGLGRADAIRAAHAAEIEHRTGLGDVVGAAHGGFEIRVRPGLPPWGVVRSFVGYGEVVLAVVDDAVPTRSVLTDRKRRAAISAAGKAATDALLDAPSLERFVFLARRFADEAGLMTPAVADALDACRADGIASQVMLGGSVFAFGRTERLAEALREFGEVYVAGIEPAGARPLAIEPAAS